MNFKDLRIWKFIKIDNKLFCGFIYVDNIRIAAIEKDKESLAIEIINKMNDIKESLLPVTDKYKEKYRTRSKIVHIRMNRGKYTQKNKRGMQASFDTASEISEGNINRRVAKGFKMLAGEE